MLRDIADIDGPEAKVFAEVYVGAFKPSERELTVTLEEVRGRLDTHRVNWAKVSLVGFAKVRVARITLEKEAPPVEAQPTEASACVANALDKVDAASSRTLAEVALDTAARLASAPREEMRVRLSERDRKVLSTPLLGERFEIEPQSTTGLGRVPIVIRRWRDGKLEEFARVCLEVSRRCLVLVTTRQIGRGEAFTPGDVEVKEMFLDQIPGDANSAALTDVSQLAGRESNATLRKGAVVYASLLRSPLLVRRGETLVVRSIAGGLVLKASAKADEDGAMDAVIKARNEKNSKPIMVRITGPREAVAVDDAAETRS